MNTWEKTNPGKQYTTANHVELKKKTRSSIYHFDI